MCSNIIDIEPQQDPSESSATLQPLPKQIIEFDWQNKWLKGEQYSHMLRNLEQYCQAFGFRKYPKKTHPDSIYSNPENGTIYFVEGDSIGSEFGFPRVSIKKRYRWKKMNFTTDLPKKRPEVTYIVASAVKCERFFPNSKTQGPLFRMHAVMLYKNDNTPRRTASPNPDQQATTTSKRYVLCHIRKLDANYNKPLKKPSQQNLEQFDKEQSKESTSQLRVSPEGSELWQAFAQGSVNYFRLFKHLHNMNCVGKDFD